MCSCQGRKPSWKDNNVSEPGKPEDSSSWMFFFHSTDRCCNLLSGKHVGIVFQRYKINNHCESRTSRDNSRSASARLLWEFSSSREVSEVSHACCCGVCPLSLSPSLSLCVIPFPPSTPPGFFSLPPWSLHLQFASVVSADCGLLSERKGYREYWSFGESLWKMAPVVTGWVWLWGSGLAVGAEGSRSYSHGTVCFIFTVCDNQSRAL